MKWIFGNTLLLLSIISCTSKTIDTKKEADALMQVSREWSDAAMSRDIEKTLSYWADDAVLISSGQPTLKGKEQIRKMVEGSNQDSSFQISWTPISAEVSQSGDMGYILEETKMTMNDSLGQPQTIAFNAVTVWKKQADGSWKNVVDVLSPKE